MTTEQKLFDLSFLESMDDENFIIEVINLYLHDTVIDLKEMESALGASDLTTMYGLAHKLKSSTGMLQANTLFAILEQIEIIAKEGVKSNQIAKLVHIALDEFNQLRTALKLHLKSMKAAA